MKTEAASHHRIFGGILAIAAAGCFIYALILYPHPLQVLFSMVPLLIVFGAFFIPYYRDHAGVTYEVNDTSVILWRKGNIRKEIQLSEVKSVRNDKQKKSIILNRKGFGRSSIYLHPKTDQDILFEAINKSAEQAGPGYPPQGVGSPDP